MHRKARTKLFGEASIRASLVPQFGEKRWEAIEVALKTQARSTVARPNFFFQPQPQQQQQHTTTAAPLCPYYVMDPTSILTALCVPVSRFHRVLDMCSAPGGKGLILLERIAREVFSQHHQQQQQMLHNTNTTSSASLHLNDVSLTRLRRLFHVLKHYVPQTLMGSTTTDEALALCSRARREFSATELLSFSRKSAAKFGITHLNHFDSILLDAPCSGERWALKTHNARKVLQTYDHSSRTRHNAHTQYELLCAAARSVCASHFEEDLHEMQTRSSPPSGCIVYATCSLSRTENDDVVARLVDRFQRRERKLHSTKGAVVSAKQDVEQGRALRVLSSKSNGMGLDNWLSCSGGWRTLEAMRDHQMLLQTHNHHHHQNQPQPTQHPEILGEDQAANEMDTELNDDEVGFEVPSENVGVDLVVRRAVQFATQTEFGWQWVPAAWDDSSQEHQREHNFGPMYVSVLQIAKL